MRCRLRVNLWHLSKGIIYSNLHLYKLHRVNHWQSTSLNRMICLSYQNLRTLVPIFTSKCKIILLLFIQTEATQEIPLRTQLFVVQVATLFRNKTMVSLSNSYEMPLILTPLSYREHFNFNCYDFSHNQNLNITDKEVEMNGHEFPISTQMMIESGKNQLPQMRLPP